MIYLFKLAFEYNLWQYQQKKEKKNRDDVWPNRVLYIIYSSATDRIVITIS